MPSKDTDLGDAKLYGHEGAPEWAEVHKWRDRANAVADELDEARELLDKLRDERDRERVERGELDIAYGKALAARDEYRSRSEIAEAELGRVREERDDAIRNRGWQPDRSIQIRRERDQANGRADRLALELREATEGLESAQHRADMAEVELSRVRSECHARNERGQRLVLEMERERDEAYNRLRSVMDFPPGTIGGDQITALCTARDEAERARDLAVNEVEQLKRQNRNCRNRIEDLRGQRNGERATVRWLREECERLRGEKDKAEAISDSAYQSASAQIRNASEWCDEVRTANAEREAALAYAEKMRVERDEARAGARKSLESLAFAGDHELRTALTGARERADRLHEERDNAKEAARINAECRDRRSLELRQARERIAELKKQLRSYGVNWPGERDQYEERIGVQVGLIEDARRERDEAQAKITTAEMAAAAAEVRAEQAETRANQAETTARFAMASKDKAAREAKPRVLAMLDEARDKAGADLLSELDQVVKRGDRLAELISRRFHDPEDTGGLCGSCNGLLDHGRDAICCECADEPEFVDRKLGERELREAREEWGRLSDEVGKLKQENAALRDRADQSAENARHWIKRVRELENQRDTAAQSQAIAEHALDQVVGRDQADKCREAAAGDRQPVRVEGQYPCRCADGHPEIGYRGELDDCPACVLLAELVARDRRPVEPENVETYERDITDDGEKLLDDAGETKASDTIPPGCVVVPSARLHTLEHDREEWAKKAKAAVAKAELVDEARREAEQAVEAGARVKEVLDAAIESHEKYRKDTNETHRSLLERATRAERRLSAHHDDLGDGRCSACARVEGGE